MTAPQDMPRPWPLPNDRTKFMSPDVAMAQVYEEMAPALVHLEDSNNLFSVYSKFLYDQAVLTAPAAASQKTVQVDPTSTLKVREIVTMWSPTFVEMAQIQAINGNTITMVNDLVNPYDTGTKVVGGNYFSGDVIGQISTDYGETWGDEIVVMHIDGSICYNPVMMRFVENGVETILVLVTTQVSTVSGAYRTYYSTKSVDGGLTWSAPFQIPVPYLECGGPADAADPIMLSNGEIMQAVYFVGVPSCYPNPTTGFVPHWRSTVIKSSDFGNTWTDPIPVFQDDDRQVSESAVIELKTGGMFGEYTGKVLMFSRVQAMGNALNLASPVTAGDTTITLTTSTVLAGDVILLMNSDTEAYEEIVVGEVNGAVLTIAAGGVAQNSYVATAHTIVAHRWITHVSEDYGETWTEGNTSMFLRSQPTKPSLIRLFDGRILFITGGQVVASSSSDCPNSTGVVYYISEDEGETFTCAYVPVQHGTDPITKYASSPYPDTVCVNNNLVTVWASNHGGGLMPHYIANILVTISPLLSLGPIVVDPQIKVEEITATQENEIDIVQQIGWDQV